MSIGIGAVAGLLVLAAGCHQQISRTQPQGEQKDFTELEVGIYTYLFDPRSETCALIWGNAWALAVDCVALVRNMPEAAAYAPWAQRGAPAPGAAPGTPAPAPAPAAPAAPPLPPPPGAPRTPGSSG